MAKKAKKQNVDKVVKKVNKEFDKTSSRIEKLIDDAIKQFDGVQNHIQEPVRKLLKELDELRDREMKRLSEEYERRLGEFHDLQNNVLDRLGIASKEAKQEAKKAAGKTSASSSAKSASKKTASGKKNAAKKAATPKKAAKPKTGTTAKSAASASKAAPKKAATAKSKPAAPKPKDKSDLTQVKGIGPATARKMKEAGITSVDQIANPSAEDQEKLQAFSNVKGFSTFGDEAKKVI
jgi:predicted flap endonuclease-1-like 5' DNA nuclease